MMPVVAAVICVLNGVAILAGWWRPPNRVITGLMWFALGYYSYRA